MLARSRKVTAMIAPRARHRTTLHPTREDTDGSRSNTRPPGAASSLTDSRRRPAEAVHEHRRAPAERIDDADDESVDRGGPVDGVADAKAHEMLEARLTERREGLREIQGEARDRGEHRPERRAARERRRDDGDPDRGDTTGLRPADLHEPRRPREDPEGDRQGPGRKAEES